MLDKKYTRRLEYETFVIIAFIFTVTCVHNATICLQKNPSSPYSTVCNTFESNITCHNNHRMRIDNLEFYKSESSTGNCNSRCGSNIAVLDVHGYDLQRLVNDIYQKCSYRQSCYLSSTFYTPTSIDTNVWSIELSYTCIEEEYVSDFCSSVEKTINGSLHLVTKSESEKCFCILPENVNITVTEYTPCGPYVCSKSKVFINRDQLFNCDSQCEFRTFNNVRLNTSEITTNVTVENIKRFMMFWISVEANYDGQARIVCNTNNSDVVQTSSTTPVTSASSSFTVIFTTEDNDNNFTTPDVPANTSDGHESQGQIHSEEFPVVPVVIGIVGSLVGVVIVILIFVFIRKRRKSVETKETTDQYSCVQFQGKSYPKKSFPTNAEFGETTGLKRANIGLNHETKHGEASNDQLNIQNDEHEYTNTKFDKSVHICLDTGAAADGDCELYAAPYNGDSSNEDNPSLEDNNIELYADVYTGQDNGDKDLSLEDNINGLYSETPIEDDSDLYAEVYTGTDSDEDNSLSEGTELNVSKDNYHDKFTDVQIEVAKEHRIPKPSDNYSHITTDNAKVNCPSRSSDTDNYNHITVNTENQAQTCFTTENDLGNYNHTNLRAKNHQIDGGIGMDNYNHIAFDTKNENIYHNQTGVNKAHHESGSGVPNDNMNNEDDTDYDTCTTY